MLTARLLLALMLFSSGAAFAQSTATDRSQNAASKERQTKKTKKEAAKEKETAKDAKPKKEGEKTSKPQANATAGAAIGGAIR